MKDDKDNKVFGVKVERKFQTFYGRIGSMMNCAGCKGELRK
jgi:hypothetical protein